MAKITRERTGTLLRKLFEYLIANPDGVQARQAIDWVASQLELTEHERGTYGGDSGPEVRRFDKILRFATIDAVKAGWMRKQKGIWSITEDGKAAFETITDPAEFYSEASRLYRRWKQAQDIEETELSDEHDEGGRDSTLTFEKAEELAWQEIWEYLEKINPYDFQDMVGALLEAMGYYVSWISPPGKDGGLDILAWTDPLGTKPPRIKVQVKRRSDNIPVQELRSFMAVLGDDEVGLFVTTGGFTKDAEDESRAQSHRKITLINRDRFVELWQEYYNQLSDDIRRKFPLKPIYFLAPED